MENDDDAQKDASSANHANNTTSEPLSDITPKPAASGELCHGAKEHAALADLQSETDNFARVKKYVTPFSRQIKEECRSSFSNDTKVYDAADKSQLRIEKIYFGLRLITLLTFSVYVYTIINALLYFVSHGEIRDFIPGGAAAFLPRFNGGELLYFSAFLVLVSLSFTFLRFLLRGAAHYELTRCTESFAHNVAMRHSDIAERMRLCAGNIFVREGRLKDMEISWEDSVTLWTKAALWNAKRAEYLDRYSTTVSWKIRLFIKRLETTTFFVKSAIVIASSYWIYTSVMNESFIHNSTAPALISIALMFLTLVLGWGYYFHWKDDFLIKEFLEKAKLEYSSETHYYNYISSRLAATAVDIEKREFGNAN
ncbi:MAG: hypothetical protein JKY46_01410 [Robiginitomaculum sp.]|nr:hypothetical protein [Robiginitomaculum sp.]